MSTIRVRVTAIDGQRRLTTEITVDRETPVSAVLAEAIARLGLSGTPRDWGVRADGTPVELFRTIGRLVSAGTPEIELELIRLETKTPAPGAAPTRPPLFPPAAVPRARGPALSVPALPPPSRAAAPSSRFDDSMRGNGSERGLKAKQRRSAGPVVTRRATVRFYTRMNPERMYPLLVILSAEQIEEVVKAAVKQAESAGFQVEAGSRLEVEPVLPGCDCYPPKEMISVDPEPVTATFYVVPRVLGRVRGARVVLRQNGRVLTEVRLDLKVRRQTLAVAFGLLGLVGPYFTMGLKHLRLDFASQQEDGFPLYRMAGNWMLDNARPEWVGLGLLVLAVLCYLWARPRRRDVFWDVTPKPVTG